MTLGHELCHLLVDHVGPGASVIASPLVVTTPAGGRAARARWNLFDGFDLMERRAGAFAACLLAPAEGVRRVVGRRDPTSEEAVRDVGAVFGLGRTTASYRLKHVYHLGITTHRAMVARVGGHWPFPEDHPDTVKEPIGMRAGVVAGWVRRALVQGAIDRVRAREILRTPFSEPLPFDDVDEQLRAPLRDRTDDVRAAAQRHLLREGRVDEAASEVSASENGWEVTVRRGRDLRGHIRLSFDLEVEEESPSP